MLYDYFTFTQPTTEMTYFAQVINDMIKDKRKFREKSNKQIFHINSSQTSDIIQNTYLNLNPHAKKELFTVNYNLGSLGIVDKYSNSVTATHNLLVNPTPANILVAFKPTSEFMQKLEESLGGGVSSFQKFLNDFVLNVYIPQVIQQANLYYQTNVNALDSFQPDRYNDVDYPLIKCVLHTVLLLHTMCHTLAKLPVHKEEFMENLAEILQKLFTKVDVKYQYTITGAECEEGDNQNIIVSSQWAKDKEIQNLLKQNTYLDSEIVNYEFNQVLCQKESILEMKKKGDRSFHRSELLFEPRKLQFMANIYYGMMWLCDQIEYLRGYDEQNTLISRSPSALPKEMYREINNGSEESLLDVQVDQEQNVGLNLTPEISETFNIIISHIKQFMDECLFTLRLEIRCRVIYYLDLAIREGSYDIEEYNPPPDPYIDTLNADLSSFEDTFSNALPPRIQRFLFDGLSQLIIHVLMTNMKYIRRFNENGVLRLVRNISSLQQNLTNLTAVVDSDLTKVKVFTELAGSTGRVMNISKQLRGF